MPLIMKKCSEPFCANVQLFHFKEFLIFYLKSVQLISRSLWQKLTNFFMKALTHQT